MRLAGRTRSIREWFLGLFVAGALLLLGVPALAAPGPTIDGHFAGTGPVRAASAVRVSVVGRGGVPSQGVAAVVLNVTATEADAPTYLTVWPTGEPRPRTSNLNIQPSSTMPNLVVVRVGADGTVSIEIGRAHV